MEMVFPYKLREYHFPGLRLKSPLQSARKTHFFSIRARCAFSPPRRDESRCSLVSRRRRRPPATPGADGATPGADGATPTANGVIPRGRRGSPRARRAPRGRGADSGRPRRGAGLCPAVDGVCCGAEVRSRRGSAVGLLPRCPARSRFPEVPGLSHPSVQKALAAAEPLRRRLPACRGRARPGTPEQAGGGPHQTLPRRRGAAQGLPAEQPPRLGPQPPRRTTPSFRRAHPPAAPPRRAVLCSPSPAGGVGGGDEELQSTRCSRSCGSPTAGVCDTGELSQTIYGRLDLPVPWIWALSIKYFDWHPSLGERGEMDYRKLKPK
ncbi:nascent polypeptide-associated complex subunit alpha, muscle-specific form-like [Rissa tridactyla]|uniref:nascent polypeptide-associated complex subunit alpha, muscle-specific form-like n=1 Tax=Rissa tridactyla TaxID=75485 RepID=UPI0023BA5E80|nr:nascent polypeptide-associated complex subunit alpha, muscle-specific form-like [Rissa tridactyla]XP_054047660.1 nascent polypeptide-associated complex subunit alpha, muscle-specific form-like [Rissa tridactyla]